MIQANIEDAYKLMHEGALTLARVERNGIRVDVGHCERQKKMLDRRRGAVEDQFRKSEVFKVWQRCYSPGELNTNSTKQLGRVLFKEMGLHCAQETATGVPSVAEEVLEAMAPDVPGIKHLLTSRKLLKISNTYLGGILREQHDGILHPFFHLHRVKTYRSASSKVNFQNMPTRDPEWSPVIRKAFIPRPGRRLLEVDYGGIEVKISACYHKDPQMLTYIKDSSTDMHRDVAIDAYLLSLAEMTIDADTSKSQKRLIKQVRHCAKNMFTFPQFYGDYFGNCATSLWASIDTYGFALKDRTPFKEHLSRHGIHNFSDFLDHMEAVENIFWNERFKVYTKWKKKYYSSYLDTGEIHMLTGFRCSGLMEKNKVLNIPIQGAAFHCLLWSLIELQKELTKRKMSSFIVGQIHDSIVMDVADEEVDDLVVLLREIMCDRVRKFWKWIIVPLEIEVELTPVDGTWFDKDVIGTYWSEGWGEHGTN